MKKMLLIIISVFIAVLPIRAQNTDGRDFWLTFGRLFQISSPDQLDLQIRIVGGRQPTWVQIDFTNLGESENFNIAPYEVYNYVLSNTQKAAVYNTTMGITNYSIRITAEKPVSVYAMSSFVSYYPITNVLPITALGTEYYQISYLPYNYLDAYAVVAIQNNTLLYHNNILEATLNMGEVYYRTFSTDLTGARITTNHPVAFFSANQMVVIPAGTLVPSQLFQQLAPVNTWGKTFFVPVTEIEKDIVRIVASQNNTNVSQTGGTIRTGVPGAQNTLTNLQAGEFVELYVYLDSAGCFIEADKPVGVCSYITINFNLTPGVSTVPSQTWVPGIEQAVSTAIIAPFVSSSISNLTSHFALISTPTATKENTEVSVGSGPPTPLSGGIWHNNPISGMSFYSMPLTNTTQSYFFSNPVGMIILGYGVNNTQASASYYYLAYSAMRNLQASFYANNIYYQNLHDATIYCGFDVNFRAEIESYDPNTCTLRWYVNDIEKVEWLNDLEPRENLPVGEYEIRMEVTCADGTETSVTGTLKILERWVKMRNIKKQ